MKRLFALLLAMVMALSLAACGGDDDKTPSNEDKTPGSSGQQEQNAPDPDGGADGPVKTDPVGTDPTFQDAPQSVEIPIDRYPFLASLVLPDDGAVTSIDDTWYIEDGIIEMVIKPMTFDKVAAYREKLAEAGYTEHEVSGLVSPDFKLELLIGDMWVDSMRYITLTIYDPSCDGGNSLTGLADLELADGIELPTEAAKYVGTFDYAYKDGPDTVKVGLRNVEDTDLERLTGYYALNGGVLDEALSTGSQQVYTFAWGSVRVSYSGADEEATLEITVN